MVLYVGSDTIGGGRRDVALLDVERDGLMEYLKINSLFKRNLAGDRRLIEGDFVNNEYRNIRIWHVEEKVDGTNVRIMYSDGKVSYGGRTDNAQMPCHLLEYLRVNINEIVLDRAFPISEDGQRPSVILFGEGYGAKIQGCGGNYRADPGFILFDVLVGRWWLKRDDVRIIGEKIGVPTCPFIDYMTVEKVIEFVKSKPLSRCSHVPQMMEGVVCRSEPLVLHRDSKPVMFKLKCKDFV